MHKENISIYAYYFSLFLMVLSVPLLILAIYSGSSLFLSFTVIQFFMCLGVSRLTKPVKIPDGISDNDTRLFVLKTLEEKNIYLNSLSHDMKFISFGFAALVVLWFFGF